MEGDEPRDIEELVRDNENLREQRQAVGEVLRAVARSEGLQPVLDEIVRAATTLCQGEHGQLYLAEGYFSAASRRDGDAAEGYAYAQAHPHRRDRTTVIGRAALAGDAVQIPRLGRRGLLVRSAEHRRLSRVARRSDHPGRRDDRRISVGRNVPGPFADQHVELVRTFADQAAIAIANARLIEPSSGNDGAVSLRPAEGCRAHLVAAGRAVARRPPRLHHLFFSDLRGFTAFAETAAPEELFEVLRPYHEISAI